MKRARFFKITFILIFLLLIFLYISNITLFPENFLIFSHETLNISLLPGLEIKQISSSNPNLNSLNRFKAIQVSNGAENENISGQIKLSLNLFGQFPLKDITVNVIPKSTVIPVGNTVGLKLYTNGVLVVGMSEIEGEDNKKYKPYENSGIEEGDMITDINEKKITCTTDLIECVNSSQGKSLKITYVRDSNQLETNITPTKTTENEYKLGLWVRDAAAGVGTVTFYEPETQTFAALGHGIMDIDTQKLINISKGEVVTTNLLSITKGEKGKPGEIKSTIEDGKTIGEVYKNTAFGIYGTLKNKAYLEIDKSKAMDVAIREEVKVGKATILCAIQNSKPQEYEIEITKVYTNNNYNNKSMEIKITDPKLLELTGGIIQGMSGSPILQGGKFIGAVTHVLVSDPTRGYGVFADLMLKQIKSVE